MADIYARPDWYYARREIPRLPSEIDEYRAELWQVQGLLRDCQRKGRWFRNTGACRAFGGRCAYFDICTGPHDPAREVPPGFVVRPDRHPELTTTKEETQ